MQVAGLVRYSNPEDRIRPARFEVCNLERRRGVDESNTGL
jgi:hypothetical protein